MAGLAGALFVAVLGNLDGLVQFIGGLRRLFVEGGTLLPFDYWRSSRMMPPTISITEFPYFTFLFADLHAHLIALPFTIVVIGSTLNVAFSNSHRNEDGLTTPSLSSWHRNLSLHNLTQIAILSLSLGALRWINSWDFPTYFALSGAALVIAEYGERRRIEPMLFGWVILKLAAVYGMSMLLYLPFHRTYELFYSGVGPSLERTPLYQYLGVNGFFGFVLLSFVGWKTVQGLARSRFINLLAWPVRYWRQLPYLASLDWPFVRRLFAESALRLCFIMVLALILLTLFLSQPGVVASLAVILLTLALLLVWVASSRGPAMPIDLYILALIALGASLGIGVELITIEGDINRMNTVFKFYLQAWVLFGLASAYCSWHTLRGLILKKGGRFWKTSLRSFWVLALAFLLASSVIYPAAATPARANDRFNLLPLTNDGMAYMKTAVYHDEKGDIELVWDYEAILWLQDNIEGSPVILEGHTPLYRWGSRVSVYTGLPTIIGWDWHQAQQRWGYREMVDERVSDVEAIYNTTSRHEALDLLREYNVRYIYVGRLERLYYGATGLAKFDSMVGNELDLAYQNRDVKIYEVKEEGV